MRAFRFPLDRALHIRRTQLEIERSKLDRLMQIRAGLARAAAELLETAIQTRREIASRPLMVSDEIAPLPAYQLATRQRVKKLEDQALQAQTQIDAQRRLTQEAEQRVKLLERLREKRFDQWQFDLDKELEDFAADAYLARWSALNC